MKTLLNIFQEQIVITILFILITFPIFAEEVSEVDLQRWLKPNNVVQIIKKPRNWYEEWQRVIEKSEYQILPLAEKIKIQTEFLRYVKDKYNLSGVEYAEAHRIVYKEYIEYKERKNIEEMKEKSGKESSLDTFLKMKQFQHAIEENIK